MSTMSPRRAVERVAVIGGGNCSPQQAEIAEGLGREIAAQGWTLYTGGLGGVMEAASRGARRGGGRVVGILPSDDPGTANPHVDLPVATGMGHARNVILVQSVDAVVAVGGEHGTLSEIAVALKVGRRVLGLGSWDIPGVEAVTSPRQAVERLRGDQSTADPFMAKLHALCSEIPSSGRHEVDEAVQQFDGSQESFLLTMRVLGKHHDSLGQEALRDLADLHRLFAERREAD